MYPQVYPHPPTLAFDSTTDPLKLEETTQSYDRGTLDSTVVRIVARFALSSPLIWIPRNIANVCISTLTGMDQMDRDLDR